MKVGDLVRHRELTYWTGIVVGVKYPPQLSPRKNVSQYIKLHDKDGRDHWEKMNEYEVLSESR